jgi:CubicO group peptidase (beta-lactamase class C family)
MKRRTIITLTATAIIGVAGAGLYYAGELLSIGVAYKAKVLCSGVFVSKRSPESVLNSDLAGGDLAILRFIDAKVDRNTQTVSSYFMNIIKHTAAYRPGLGCTLVFADQKNALPRLHIAVFEQGHSQWPEERTDTDVSEHVDLDQLNVTLDWAFSEPDPEHLRRTRAVIIVHKGRIIGERYAPGFDKDTPLMGWSMTKSVMNALAGILVGEGKLSLTDQVSAPEWQEPNNGRHNITLDHLLHMNSGLDFDENYTNPLADVTYMLLRVPDTAAYAASKQLVANPGTRWRYSSGTTNILSRFVRLTVGESNYLSFPHRALFKPLGMHSAVMEPDASGTFVGSSFMYATARDWAKFGQLYLQDGLWQGKRILPEGWIDYTTTPAPQAPHQQYGAHFWLKIPMEFTSGVYSDRLPDDAFHAVGHEGQFVTVVPSRDLVIVRLGLSRFASAWQHDQFVWKVLEAIAA